MSKPTLTYGCEIEMFQSSSQVPTALTAFRDAGLCVHDRLHDYHCRCPVCTYDRPTGALLAAQTDPTVGAEFITRILSTRNNLDTQEMRKLKGVYSDVLEETGWHPDGNDENGNHVHVGWPEGTTSQQKGQTNSLLQGMWHAEQSLWDDTIATGGAGTRRSYNEPPEIDQYDGDHWYGGWLGANSGTIEFRVWNTPSDPERLLVHPALSVAMLHWALDVIDEEGDNGTFDRARTTAAWAANRARGSRKRIAKTVQEIWPDRRSARLAAELISA